MIVIMNQEEQKGIRNWVKSRGLAGEALIVAGFTAVAYLSACAYQIAYLLYFKIPLIFLDIQLSHVLLMGLIGLVWGIAVFFGISSLINNKFFTPKIRLHIVAVSAMLQIFLPIIIFLVSPIHLFRTLASLLFIVIVAFYMVKDLNRESRGKEKENALEGFVNDQKDLADMVLDKLERSFGTVFVMSLFIGIFFIFYGAGFGLIVAKIKSDFLIPSTQPDIAIVHTKGENFVGIIFNPATRKLTKDIKVITPEHISSDTIFKNEKLEPTYNYDR